MMKRTPLVLATLLTVWIPQTYAQSFKLDTIEVDDPWMRATPKGATTAAGYFKITNSGSTADRLTGGSSDVASRVEIHEMSMTAGHGVGTPGPAGYVHLAADLLHLSAASAWLGGLIPLALLIGSLRQSDGHGWAEIAYRATHRFSNLGVVSVGTLAVSGIFNSWFLVGGVNSLVGTSTDSCCFRRLHRSVRWLASQPSIGNVLCRYFQSHRKARPLI